VRPQIERVEEVLIDSELADSVDMVLSRPAPDLYRASTATGSTTFRRSTETHPHGERYAYAIETVDGIDPLRNRDDGHLIGLHAELAQPFPDRDTTSYPHAFDQIAQFFDAAHAPDLVVQHTAAHHVGGNLGQHGSLGIVQARAPFIASGAGVASLGTVDAGARMVDIAPSIMELLGGAPHPDGIGPTGSRRRDALLARQDGDVIGDLFERGGARHVVVILLDGCNSNVLYDAVASGDAPGIASLAATGSTLARGLMASMPTATLANHTTASTGAHPGHSGVLHNQWLDRTADHVPDLLAMDQVFDAMRHLRPDVETIHQAVHRNDPAAFTAACFEFCDTGADMSSFAAFRNGTGPALPVATELAAAHQDFVAGSGVYGFMTSVDELATRQTIELWDRTEGNPLPAFTFLTLSLTDESGHETGPNSEMTRAAIIDSDRRVGRVLDAIDRSGARSDTAVLVFADHGMEISDPTNTDDWAAALHDSGIACRDVADGLIYLPRPQTDRRQ